MKKINLIEHYPEYISLLEDTVRKKLRLIFWQKLENGDRSIRYVYLTKVDKSKSLFDFIPESENPFRFEINQGIYGFCEDNHFIFKAQIHSTLENKIILKLPNEINSLIAEDPIMKELFLIKGNGEGNFTDILKVKGSKAEPTSDIMRVRSLSSNQKQDDLIEKHLSPEQEDKAFAAIRESQRIKPKDDKYVTILRIDHDQEKQIYKLLDLSQGGAGLHCLLPNEFTKGEKISLIEIDGKPVDKPLNGEVVAIRPTNEENTEYKIGIKFST